MGIIDKHPDFTRFNYIVRLARLQGILDAEQANFTIFVPSDSALSYLNDSVFVNMDDATARHIVKSSLLDRKITSELLEDSPASFFITKDTPNRLFVSNISGNTFLNNNIRVIHKDIIANNGIIHVTDNILWPSVM